MAKELRFRILEEAAEAIEDFRRITDAKDVVQVVVDAFRTYEWILEQQMSGRTIVSENGNPEDAIELDSFVKDKIAAEEYFATV